VLWRPRERELTREVETPMEDGDPIQWVLPQRP
jgi:hypothetical protein